MTVGEVVKVLAQVVECHQQIIETLVTEGVSVRGPTLALVYRGRELLDGGADETT